MDAAGSPLDQYAQRAASERRQLTADVATGYRHAFRPQQHELSFEVRRNGSGGGRDALYNRFGSTPAGTLLSEPGERTFVDNEEHGSELSFQADYIRPVLGLRLETGYKGWLRHTDNDELFELFAPVQAVSPDRSTHTLFDYSERIHSGYVLVGRQLGSWSLQAGLRGEQVDTEFDLRSTGERFDNGYASLFPSGNVGYNFGGGRQARLTYNKRVERPNVYYLNPSMPSADPWNQSIGNPHLEPKYTHSVALDLSWAGQKGSIRTAPFYRHTVDNWSQIRDVNEAGVSTLTWANVASLEAYGMTLTGSLRSSGRIGGLVAVTGYREVRDASNLAENYSGHAWVLAASGNANLRVNSQLDLQGSLRYSPARELPQGRVSSSLMTTFGAKQKLRGEQMSLNISVADPFDLYRFNFTTRDRAHVQTSRSDWKVRAATISLSYMFGKQHQRNGRRRDGADDSQSEGEPRIR
jgi:hypothetical protein